MEEKYYAQTGRREVAADLGGEERASAPLPMPRARKYYVLEMFPVSVRAGFTMGHVRNYSIGDVVARLQADARS
jgi:leucyl-tRNA synthetase